MDRVTVITDVDTKLGYSLLTTYLENGEKAVGVSSVKKSKLAFPGTVTHGHEIVEWNRHSAIDSRSAVVEILTKHKRIDEVLIVQSLSTDHTSIEVTDSALINKSIDYWVKGNLYFSREVLRYFSEKKSGALVLINHIEADDKNHASPLAETMHAAFSGLVHSLLPLYAGKDVCINGFESKSLNHEEFARFIYKNICERFRKISGKLLVFQNQKSLFGALKK